MDGSRWLAGLTCLALTAQTPPPADPMLAASKAFEEGRYLDGVNGFAAAAFGTRGKVRDDDFALQMWSQTSPTITGELPMDTFSRTSTSSPDVGWVASVRRARSRDALTEIVRSARSTNIVILNEAHYSPRDRAFGLTVANALRPLGYDTLAVETFDSEVMSKGPNIAQLAADGVVRRQTGYFTQDPVFAGFIREAMRSGYRPVAYEQTEAQRGGGAANIARREQAQTDNLMARVFAAKPLAKVLI